MSNQPSQDQTAFDNTGTVPIPALDVVPHDDTDVRKKAFKESKKVDKFLVKVLKCLMVCNPCRPVKLLDPLPEGAPRRKTLVLDLDETLVHSSPGKIEDSDFLISFKSGGSIEEMSVMKRPFVDEFLERVAKTFEVVVFTAGVAEYAKSLMETLDKKKLVSKILSRKHCTYMHGVYVKNMAKLGRDIKDVILVDNSPNSFLLQPENAFHIESFFDDKEDRELQKLVHFLEYIEGVHDVRPVKDWILRFNDNISIGEKQRLTQEIDCAQIVLTQKPNLEASNSNTAATSAVTNGLLLGAELTQSQLVPRKSLSVESEDLKLSPAKPNLMPNPRRHFFDARQLNEGELLDDIGETPKDENTLLNKTKTKQKTVLIPKTSQRENYENGRKYKSLDKIDTERKSLTERDDEEFDRKMEKIEIIDLEERAKMVSDFKYFMRRDVNSPIGKTPDELKVLFEGKVA